MTSSLKQIHKTSNSRAIKKELKESIIALESIVDRVGPEFRSRHTEDSKSSSPS